MGIKALITYNEEDLWTQKLNINLETGWKFVITVFKHRSTIKLPIPFYLKPAINIGNRRILNKSQDKLSIKPLTTSARVR